MDGQRAGNLRRAALNGAPLSRAAREGARRRPFSEHRYLAALLAVVAAVLGLGWVTTPARAAVTIGSDLTHEPNDQGGCSNQESIGCVLVHNQLTGATIRAPTAGVITRWRIRTRAGNEPSSVRLRIVRALAWGYWFVSASGQAELPPGPATSAYATSLAVEAGDRIGLETEQGRAIGAYYVNPDAQTYVFTENHHLGQVAAYPAVIQNGFELTVNADLEPDVDHDGLGDETQDDDLDNDGAVDSADNCPGLANADQADVDGDEIGDPCDPDRDGDVVANDEDNCPALPNAGQQDADADNLGDPCDPDRDGDGSANADDPFPDDPVEHADADADADGSWVSAQERR